MAIDRDTACLLPPSVDEWLPQHHLARFVVAVIDPLDLSEPKRQYAGRGSDAYHPAMLLGLLIYGYATGLHASRKIEHACHGPVAMRFIAANASKHRALSWAHAKRIEAQLWEAVQLLLKLAEDSVCRPVNDALDVPVEIARREQRLGALEQAKLKIKRTSKIRFKRTCLTKANPKTILRAGPPMLAGTHPGARSEQSLRQSSRSRDQESQLHQAV